jgi:hypothetical protein
MKLLQATLLSILVKLGVGTSCIRIENKLHKILPEGSIVVRFYSSDKPHRLILAL